MTPPNALADKGDVVEEWIDRKFFRPIGIRIATRLEPGGVTPDQVTGWSLALGLVAGHLFYYRDWRLNAAGLFLFLLSDVFDSADGQLARLRGTSTRLGRILDGLSDNLRFVNLYLHLIARVVVAGSGWGGVLLAIVAGVSHSVQASAADFIRQLYLGFAGGKGEVDLPEDLDPPGRGFRRLAQLFYAAYVRRQARLFPASIDLWRAARTNLPAGLQTSWTRAQRKTVVWCAVIGQNVRFGLLAVTAMIGWPAGFFLLTAVPLNLALVALVARQERFARQIARVAAEQKVHPSYA
jgi:hypothetical protein